ncbi:hypothetical protein CXG81DRAFT_25853 [Caulochytrium protostelioides]|uniref:Replication factor A protein 3 n=1 Tax=Caulochytrium protostelioides TaxID=1555241 RepID=A0A4V1IUR4_9FUNG|nr:hypothetical protein CXG81DRAFT_25853 [Caulochytrium protostelioides]|eukprot:RKP01469.1 hypothetical protein CXG81DRAFT_25853 [Caulochytrium protostelioides]
MAATTIRITSAHLQSTVGKLVRIAGRVLSRSSETAVLQAADMGEVTIQLGPDSMLQPDTVAEIMGRVNPDLSIQEMTSNTFDGPMDMETHAKMVDYAHQYGELF